MELKQWTEAEWGRSARLAVHLMVRPSFISKMAAGTKPIPVGHMARIEAFTGGAVTRQEMCPHWQIIWPELANKQPNQAVAVVVPSFVAIETVAPLNGTTTVSAL